MGVHLSTLRETFRVFQGIKSKVLALSEIRKATGVHTDQYEFALEMYETYRDKCRELCMILVKYYERWMINATMMLIILRSLEENRKRLTPDTLETSRKMMRRYYDLFRHFDIPGGISTVIPQVLVHFEANESDALSTAISQVLAELDRNGDGNGGAVEDDTAADEGEQEQNQDLPDTDSEKN